MRANFLAHSPPEFGRYTQQKKSNNFSRISITWPLGPRWPRPFNALRWKSFPRSWVSKTQKKLYKVEKEILLENSGDNPMSQKVRIWLKIFYSLFLFYFLAQKFCQFGFFGPEILTFQPTYFLFYWQCAIFINFHFLCEIEFKIFLNPLKSYCFELDVFLSF